MIELEKKALDCIKNHSHTLVQNATESDIEKREMELYIEGYKQCTREMQKENEQLEIEAAKLRTIKDSYKKLLKDIHDTMREPIDIGDYLIDEFGDVFADWDSCVKEDWEVEG